MTLMTAAQFAVGALGILCALWAAHLLLRVLVLLDHLERAIATSAATGDRLEAGAAIIASDLHDARRRADAVDDGVPGEASDAASRSEQP